MEPTLNYQDLDDSYLDYIQYLSTLSGQQPPQWDSPPDSDWTNPFASEGGGRQEAFIQLNPQKCDKFIELAAANVEMEYPCLRRLVEEVSPVKVRQLPDLEIPPPECYMILEVDGCMDGWGGICKWKKKKFDPVSSEKICAYSSGKFNPPKSTIDAELYAVMNTMEALKIYFRTK
ncbi:hypothetical protein ZIOFF_028514 [Zingiber officinale]|uniref:Uncharacterized protein n=1 Tax=Zingiber officinale TaxID=94328 RepID=A0A8J5L3M2_ZINOF|nr:hypothetical protein ZIOFF_028514 [Zingiber officinale]